MLSRATQVPFFLFASMLWHSSATAQIADEGFSYAQKNESIALARLGDANALYQLGLSHLHGLNSVQNEPLAKRFFFYAAEKDHPEAKTYLASLKDTVTAPKQISPSRTVIKPPSGQSGKRKNR